MLIQCQENINKDQIKELQKFKTKAEKFDSSRKEFAALVEVDLSQFENIGFDPDT